MHTRDVHGDGDDGNPADSAGMGTNTAGIPREWKATLRGSRGGGKKILRDSRPGVKTHSSKMLFCHCCTVIVMWNQLNPETVDGPIFLHGLKQ